jgi:cytochrome c oxidase assembly protein subunit 15
MALETPVARSEKRSSRRRLPGGIPTTISPEAYTHVARFALLSLTLIVFTGAAVRLTGSGLGCPDWPACYGKYVPPLQIHALIEFGNRIISGAVGIAAVAAGVLAFRRRPFRRDLALIGILLPLGVVSQAVLGGFTVRHELEPGYVMAHFSLSMLILIAASLLLWRARHEPGSRERSSDRLAVWSVRALCVVGAFAIVLGTTATAAGPHAGASGTGEIVHRIDWKGRGTLDWAIHQHAIIAAILGVGAVATFFLLRMRGAPKGVRMAVGVACVLLATQGIVGTIQYYTHLPTEIVWVHVALAVVLWLALLWAVEEAGRLRPRRASAAR